MPHQATGNAVSVQLTISQADSCYAYPLRRLVTPEAKVRLGTVWKRLGTQQEWDDLRLSLKFVRFGGDEVVLCRTRPQMGP